MSIVGRTYLERGQPVEVTVQWGPGGGPRNVTIRRADGTLTVRPFRGLRRTSPPPRRLPIPPPTSPHLPHLQRHPQSRPPGGPMTPEPSTCQRCETASTTECCSVHQAQLCHACYRRTHFVERCVEGCRQCANENLPLVYPAPAGSAS